MLLKENATSERLRGSYYTPKELANYIVKWAIDRNKINKILEPSCGDGVFLECMQEQQLMKKQNITAIEIDKSAAELTYNKIKDSNVYNSYREFIIKQKNSMKDKRLDIQTECNIITDDFYTVYEERLKKDKFKAIVGNPPYIRYQYLTELQREEQSNILKSNGMKSNKLINAWVSFVVACIEILDSNSRIGLVIPAELLQVAYAEDLREFLMKSLQQTTIITFKELVFPDVQQEVVVLLGEKNSKYDDEHKLKIIEYQNINELIQKDNINDFDFCNVEINESKWTKYFLTNNNIKLISDIKQDNRFVKFNQLAKIEVGITTGNNEYFCINEEKANEYNLKSVCRPLIARSVNISGIKFSKEDWIDNIQKGARTYLIDFPDIPYDYYPEKHKEYIEYGEKTKQNKGYKCRIRDAWYRVPSIWVPDAFLLRRNHLYPKFVLNSKDVNAVSTDTMHRVRFNNPELKNRILLSYYNSIALAFTEIEGRSYGGGVLEILPKEVGRIMLPNLSNKELISDELVEELVNKIDKSIRENNNIEAILDEIDKKILIDIIGMPKDVVFAFRKMWLTLRDRRLERGNKI